MMASDSVKAALNPKGGLDVNIQDQTTPPIEYFLSYKGASFVLANDINAGDNTFIAVDVSPLEGGCYIEIYTASRMYQAEVLSIDAPSNTFRTDTPIGFDCVTAPGQENSVVSSDRVCVDLSSTNVPNGTLDTPTEFSMKAPSGVSWDLTRLTIDMILASTGDDGKFGDQVALINGIYFGREGNDFTGYLVNIKDNAGFRSTAYDVQYTVRSGGGGDAGMAVRKSFSGQDKYGVAIRLEGKKNDTFFCRTQDTLTGLGRFRIKVMGHLVD